MAVVRLSKPNVIRRFIEGESTREIAKDIGCSRNYILTIVRSAVRNACPDAGYTAFGPVTERRAAKILRTGVL